MLFKKQADNLKTNHNGTYVIQDNRFRYLTRVSQVSHKDLQIIKRIKYCIHCLF